MPRDYVRVSESADCRLRIGYRMTGMEPESPIEDEDEDAIPIALRMGRALEPIILQEVRARGLTVHWAEDELELHLDDPFRVGHPDGVIESYMEGADHFHDLPQEIITLLNRGEVLVLENKTMKADRWARFAAQGLDGDAILRKYQAQVRAYVYGLMLPFDGWPQADAFKTWLRLNEYTVGATALIAGLNKDTGEIAFRTLPFDANAYRQDCDRILELYEWMDANRLPPPDHDGSAPECFYCEFSYVCPAFQEQQAREEQETEVAEGTLVDQLLECAQEWKSVQADAKEIDQRRGEIKEKVESIVGLDRKVQIPGWTITTAVRSRSDPDVKQLKEMYGDNLPMKQSKPWHEVRFHERKVK